LQAFYFYSLFYFFPKIVILITALQVKKKKNSAFCQA